MSRVINATQYVSIAYEAVKETLSRKITYFSHQLQQINLLLPIRNNFPVGGTINSRGWNILTTLANWENIIANMDYIFVALLRKESSYFISLLSLVGIRFDHSWVKSLKVYKSCRHVLNDNAKIISKLRSWDS